MPKPTEDAVDVDRLREVGRRGAKLDVEQTLGVIVEESANAFEGLGRRLHAIERMLRTIVKHVLEGDEEAGVEPLIEQMKSIQKDLSAVQKQLKESGMLKKTHSDRMWELFRDIIKILGGILAAVAIYYAKKYLG